MFKGNVEIEPEEQAQVKNIQVKIHTETVEIADFTFQYHDYKFQKKADNYGVPKILPPAFCQAEKLIYFVYDINTHHSGTSEYYFCRPPPSCS